MRRLVPCLLLVSLMPAGCQWLKSDRNSPRQEAAVSGTAPTAAELVGYLNRQADHLSTIASEDVDLTATVENNRMPMLRCVMFCDKPHCFRLMGTAVGTDYVDLGSNNDQFWFWVKDGPNPPLYYCSYADYDRGAQLPLPFQPEWVLQALGMAKYDPNKPYRIEAKGNTYELSEDVTVQGKPMRKITVFTAQRPRDSSMPQVTGHVIQDARTGAVVCKATIRRVRNAEKSGIFYPSDVVLEWPEKQISMAMKIGKATINQPFTADKIATYFGRPDSMYKDKVDIARMQFNGSPTSRTIEPAGGFR